MLFHRSSNTAMRAQTVSPALVAFFIIYVFLVIYCRLAFYRDPTSLFFDPSVAYHRQYSSFRQHQAEKFIDSASETGFLRSDNTTLLSLCVGIATVARDGERYFRSSIGSLLQGLTEEERQDIHLITFIAHTDPTMHPEYYSPGCTTLQSSWKCWQRWRRRKEFSERKGCMTTDTCWKSVTALEQLI